LRTSWIAQFTRRLVAAHALATFLAAAIEGGLELGWIEIKLWFSLCWLLRGRRSCRGLWLRRWRFLLGLLLGELLQRRSGVGIGDRLAAIIDALNAEQGAFIALHQRVEVG
jgi:hypothetical protein